MTMGEYIYTYIAGLYPSYDLPNASDDPTSEQHIISQHPECWTLDNRLDVTVAVSDPSSPRLKIPGTLSLEENPVKVRVP